MEDRPARGPGLRRLVGLVSFMAIGVSTVADPLNRFNLYRLGVGILLGLLFGGLFKRFLALFLGWFNGAFRREYGREAVRYVVESGTVFMAPFAFMLLVAVYYLGWSMTVGFVSAGVMAVGTAVAIDMAKIQGRSELKNTAVTTAVSFLFSLLWTLTFPYYTRAPLYLEGGLRLLRSLAGGGGGL